jgi:hypothetical protein
MFSTAPRRVLLAQAAQIDADIERNQRWASDEHSAGRHDDAFEIERRIEKQLAQVLHLRVQAALQPREVQ